MLLFPRLVFPTVHFSSTEHAVPYLTFSVPAAALLLVGCPSLAVCLAGAVPSCAVPPMAAVPCHYSPISAIHSFCNGQPSLFALVGPVEIVSLCGQRGTLAASVTDYWQYSTELEGHGKNEW